MCRVLDPEALDIPFTKIRSRLSCLTAAALIHKFWDREKIAKRIRAVGDRKSIDILAEAFWCQSAGVDSGNCRFVLRFAVGIKELAGWFGPDFRAGWLMGA